MHSSALFIFARVQSIGIESFQLFTLKTFQRCQGAGIKSYEFFKSVSKVREMMLQNPALANLIRPRLTVMTNCDNFRSSWSADTSQLVVEEDGQEGCVKCKTIKLGSIPLISPAPDWQFLWNIVNLVSFKNQIMLFSEMLWPWPVTSGGRSRRVTS